MKFPITAIYVDYEPTQFRDADGEAITDEELVGKINELYLELLDFHND